jgi:hypothetical protein
METEQKKNDRNDARQIFIDRFFVPQSGIGEFKQRMQINRFR